MRILLINTNRKVDFLAAPPLGLCYVASATEAAGHEVHFLDLCFAGQSVGTQIESAVRSFQPDVLGLSIRNIDNVNMLHPVSYLPGIQEIVEHIRELTAVPLVLGGSGASLMPECVLRLLRADYIVVADGEQSFVRLLAAIENGESSPVIPGVGMLREDRFVLTPPILREFKGGTADLGKWIDIDPYQKIGSSYNIQTKRGCRQRCIYCTYNQSLEGNRLRLRSPKDVVDEVEEALFKYHPHTFEFVDSVFNDPPDHAAEIMEEIIRRPWKAEFTAMGVHPQKLDDEYLKLMWRAGFRSLMITPESASDGMLRSYRKGFTREDVVYAAEAINKTSFAAWWFFMIGGPGETNETLQESLDFAMQYLQRNGRRVTNVAHYFVGVRIYPGTTLWDRALREGFVTSHADPLRLVWYLSRDLDLDRAVDQMTAAASICPEIFLGFDESILDSSKTAAMFFRLLRLPRPYWRYFRAASLFGLRTGIRFRHRPPNIAQMLREALRQQGVECAGT